ncbi:hypothetical protein AKJ57_03570 [candidate division MSBL1 archaeon SCGC-AAA259A05]|uniref:Uncharacterized protein n=1 Tax=candidate division MSBL1 archaeon SCGC-AAA259A05 TaxID=1698259 RepID=A0A133U9E3_9EURY|nr:hypothetical protein AKJ57_03570 [candidate division MSBL1 archaeon SCGC-AAA259A05]
MISFQHLTSKLPFYFFLVSQDRWKFSLPRQHWKRGNQKGSPKLEISWTPPTFSIELSEAQKRIELAQGSSAEEVIAWPRAGRSIRSQVLSPKERSGLHPDVLEKHCQGQGLDEMSEGEVSSSRRPPPREWKWPKGSKRLLEYRIPV